MDYARYYFPVLVQMAAYVGFAWGGGWVWIGIASLRAFGLIDSLLPDDMVPRKMREGFLADLPVWISTPLAVGLYVKAAFWVAHTPEISGL